MKALLAANADVNAQTDVEPQLPPNGTKDSRILAPRCNVKRLFPDAGSPLICAAFEGHVDTVCELLAANAKVDAQNQRGWSALLCAAEKGHLSTVQKLLDAGAAGAARALPGARSNGHEAVVTCLSQVAFRQCIGSYASLQPFVHQFVDARHSNISGDSRGWSCIKLMSDDCKPLHDWLHQVHPQTAADLLLLVLDSVLEDWECCEEAMATQSGATFQGRVLTPLKDAWTALMTCVHDAFKPYDQALIFEYMDNKRLLGKQYDRKRPFDVLALVLRQSDELDLRWTYPLDTPMMRTMQMNRCAKDVATIGKAPSDDEAECREAIGRVITLLLQLSNRLEMFSCDLSVSLFDWMQMPSPPEWGSGPGLGEIPSKDREPFRSTPIARLHGGESHLLHLVRNTLKRGGGDYRKGVFIPSWYKPLIMEEESVETETMKQDSKLYEHDVYEIVRRASDVLLKALLREQQPSDWAPPWKPATVRKLDLIAALLAHDVDQQVRSHDIRRDPSFSLYLVLMRLLHVACRAGLPRGCTGVPRCRSGGQRSSAYQMAPFGSARTERQPRVVACVDGL